MIFSKCTVGPADRFNAGQKMHLLVVLSVLIGFSVSGSIMMLRPGALGAWIVHVLCFIPAAAFLGLHLFLSLINPETRKALPAIFTGFVSQQYASEHHALWVKTKVKPVHSQYVSWKMVLACVIILMILISIGLGVYGFERLGQRMQLTWQYRAANAIMPGALSSAHTQVKELQQCISCHTFTESPEAKSCFTCHKSIAERMQSKSGFHGTFSDSCSQCHKEHQGSDCSLIDLVSSQFTHDKANFKLKGQHQDLACKECHQHPDDPNRLIYTGLDYASCISCPYDN
jgi:hypothetical protein